MITKSKFLGLFLLLFVDILILTSIFELDIVTKILILIPFVILFYILENIFKEIEKK